MKNSPEEVLKSIPDFDDFLKLSDNISSLMYKKLSLEANIKDGEARVFRQANTNEEYFQGGKPASVAFIDNTYKFTGLTGELLPLRKELAEATAELEGAKLKLDVYKNMVEIWRTLCSNQRTGGF